MQETTSAKLKNNTDIFPFVEWKEEAPFKKDGHPVD
jgi:hypothetical protein